MESSCVRPIYEGCASYRAESAGLEGCRSNTACVCLINLFTTYKFDQNQYDRQLHSLRPPLTDVPAVYFVSPTLANIKRISEDLQKCLYESFHFNFVEPLPRALLEELAAAVAKDGTGDLVEQVRLEQLIYCASVSNASACRFLTNISRSLRLRHPSFPFFHLHKRQHQVHSLDRPNLDLTPHMQSSILLHQQSSKLKMRLSV